MNVHACWRARLGAVALALALSPAPAPAQSDTAQPLQVATRVVPPFVMKADGRLTGFTIELANAVAREAGFSFSYVETDSLPALLGAVEGGRADLAAAAISITSSRAERFDFSQPIFAAGVQIMTREGGAETNSIVPSFLAFFASRPFFELIGALLLLFIVPAPLIWLLERRHAHGVVASSSTLGEIFKSMFWSATTVIGQTAGHPVSWPGRIIALIWMLIGLTFISYFTASVTSALTVRQLQASIGGLSDLAGKRVVTVGGSSSADFLAARSIVVQPHPTIDKALDALVDGRADAAVYDAPVLLYFAAHDGAGKVRLVGDILKPEDYGLLFPLGSRYRKPIDQALLRLRERGDYQKIYDHWFKSAAAAGD